MGAFSSLFGDDTDYYNNLSAPDANSEKYRPTQQTAQTYNAQQLGANALAGAQGNVGAQNAQQQALAGMQQQAQGGLNAADKSALFNIQQQQAANNRGQQAAIMQGAAQRGAANSGASLAAQLEAQQAGAQNSAQQGMDIAGQAAQRAQAANAQAAQTAGNINQQQFAQQAAIGEAQNAINAANANAANEAAARNTQAQNQVGEFNIANQIGASQFGAQMQNQQFNNQLALDQARTGADISREGLSNSELGTVAGGVGAALGFAHGGPIPTAPYSPEEALRRVDFRDGGRVHGQATVAGDSPKNDTVPAWLSPKEQVVPRSIALQHDALATLKFLEKHGDAHFGDAIKVLEKHQSTGAHHAADQK